MTDAGAERRVCFVDGARAREGAALPLDDHGVLLGDSVFETLRAYGGRPFMLGAHLDRLCASAAWARMTIGGDRETLAAELARASSEIGDAAVRIFVTRGPRSISAPLIHAKTRRIVFAEPIAIDESLYARGATACTLAQRTFGTLESAHAKYARYLPRLLARDEAHARGAGEPLLVDDDGCIAEAATASVFVVRGDEVITSSVLEGLTRKIVLSDAGNLGLACVLRPITREDVALANEMFITSSLREVLPIVSVDGRPIGDGKVGERARALRAALRRRATAVT